MTDLLDPRQRLAAAQLLSAIDLPAPLPDVSALWSQAAKVCPGVTIDKANFGSRAAGLRAARDLIDAMLAEIEPHQIEAAWRAAISRAHSRAALRPFAALADLWGDEGAPECPDDAVVVLADGAGSLDGHDLCVGDFRRARAAFSTPAP